MELDPFQPPSLTEQGSLHWHRGGGRDNSTGWVSAILDTVPSRPPSAACRAPGTLQLALDGEWIQPASLGTHNGVKAPYKTLCRPHNENHTTHTAAHNGKDTAHIVPDVLVVQLLQVVKEDLTILVKPRSWVCGVGGRVWRSHGRVGRRRRG